MCWQKIYTGNATETVQFTDVAGNAGSANVQITRIDTVIPQAVAVFYTPPATLPTLDDVVVTLFIDKPVQFIDGREGTGMLWTRRFTNNFAGDVQFTDFAGNAGSTGINITRIQVPIWDITYNGTYQTFIAPQDGYYDIELRGAGGYGSAGGYTKGRIRLNSGQQLYLYPGQQGNDRRGYIGQGTFNGGGNGSYTCYVQYNASFYYDWKGGGATDVRLVSGAWNDATGLKSRIMVAGAGGANGQ
jgi:hypothetical protein